MFRSCCSPHRAAATALPAALRCDMGAGLDLGNFVTRYTSHVPLSLGAMSPAAERHQEACVANLS